jgi:hypothetical protein
MPAPTFTHTIDPKFVGIGTQRGVFYDATRYNIRCTANGPADQYQAEAYLRSQFLENTPHPSIPSMVCLGCAIIEIQASGSLFTGEVKWGIPDGGSTQPPGLDAAGLLDLPARVESLNFDFYQEPCDTDRFGKPICNSAGDPFDPAGTIEKSRAILVLSKYKKSYVASTYLPFFGKLNDRAYNVPALGSSASRTLRCVCVKPAAGFNPVGTVATGGITGVFVNGETVTWAGGGTAVLVSVSGSTLTIMNPNISIAATTVITGGTSGAHAAASADVILPPVKVYWVFEYRPDGFDYDVLDKGTRGWWTDSVGDVDFLGHIFVKKDHVEVSAPVLLHNGRPSQDTDYDSGNPDFDSWVDNKDAFDQPAGGGRATLGTPEVTRTTVTIGGVVIDKLKFQRIDQTNFAGIGL